MYLSCTVSTFTSTFALCAECIYYLNVLLNYCNLHYFLFFNLKYTLFVFKKLNHYTTGNDEHSIGVDKFYNTIFFNKKNCAKKGFFS